MLLRARRQAAWKEGVLLRGSVWREALRESLRDDTPIWVTSEAEESEEPTVIESESETSDLTLLPFAAQDHGFRWSGQEFGGSV